MTFGSVRNRSNVRSSSQRTFENGLAFWSGLPADHVGVLQVSISIRIWSSLLDNLPTSEIDLYVSDCPTFGFVLCILIYVCTFGPLLVLFHMLCLSCFLCDLSFVLLIFVARFGIQPFLLFMVRLC